jgi:hypothetical protein
MAADRVRDEAERLVAAAVAALSSATRGLGNGSGFATGSAECCVCPVCRAIAAVRDPNSDLADRLASGVGDLATGVAAILRTLTSRGGRTGAPEEPATAEGDEFWEDLRRKAATAAKAYGRPSTPDANRSSMDDPWRAATRVSEAEPVAEPTAVPEALVPQPTLAKKTPAPGASQRSLRSEERTGGAGTRGAVAKKAVAKKAVAKKAAAPTVAAAEPVAKKAVAKKAVAKKMTAPGASQRSLRSEERTGGAGTRGNVKRVAPADGVA